MKPSKATLLEIYSANLKRYEEEGDDTRAAIQRRLVAKLRDDVATEHAAK